MAKAVIGAVLIHGRAGKSLWNQKGWFTPYELAQACAQCIAKKSNPIVSLW
jgi:NAD(P)H-hydrate repair Nnr-like enzyme with NAD(P)H-hydrate dehydratase domain